MQKNLQTNILDKNILGYKLNEFILNSQYNIDNTLKSVFTLLNTLKTENDQIVSKSIFNNYFILICYSNFILL